MELVTFIILTALAGILAERFGVDTTDKVPDGHRGGDVQAEHPWR